MIPILAKVKTALTQANVLEQFPGGAVSGDRFDRPMAFPFLIVMPGVERGDMRTAKGGYQSLMFDMGIAGRSLEECGDEALTKALDDVIVGITAGGVVSLNSTLRLQEIRSIPETVRYQQEDGYWACYITFAAKFSS